MELQELMRQVRLIELRTTKLVTGMFAGLYLSSFKGRGIEFDEIREYSPGDDVRAIDWNVTARTGKPFIKRFVEEREMTVLLAVDISASGSFGTTKRYKNELAAEICATLALSATRNNDRVGLVLFTDQVEEFHPPRKGRNHIMQIIRTLLTARPKHPGTNISRMLNYLNAIAKRRSLVFIISDFRTEEDFSHQLRVTARRHDVVAIRVIDNRERDLPPVGLIRLQDAETGTELVVDLSSPKVREMLTERAAARDTQYSAEFKEQAIDTITISTDDRFDNALQSFFANRIRRRER
jgi:uncharacterized protein (DUF58 family)